MKYISRKDIKSATIKHNGSKITLSPEEFLNGAYRLAKGGDLSDYKYVPKRNVLSIETKTSVITDNLNGLYVKKSALETKKPKSVKSVKFSKLKHPNKVIDLEAYPIFKNLINNVDMALKLHQEKKPVKDVRVYVDFAIIEIESFVNEFSDDENYMMNLAYIVLWSNYVLPKKYNLSYYIMEAFDGKLREAFIARIKELPSKDKKIARIKDKDVLNSSKISRLIDNFASKDDLRPVLNGSKIDDGYLITTNAHILLAIYSSSLKNKKEEILSISKFAKKTYGKKIDGKYPNWRAVIPRTTESLKINGTKLYNKIKKIYDYELYNTTTGAVGLKLDEVNYAFNISFLLICLRSLIALKGDNLFIHFQEQTSRAIIISPLEDFDVNKDDSFTLMMPVVSYGLKNLVKVNANNYEIFKKGGVVNN